MIDEKLRHFIRITLEDNPEKRATIEQLLKHEFLEKSKSDHTQIKLSNELSEIIKAYQVKRSQKSQHNTTVETSSFIQNDRQKFGQFLKRKSNAQNKKHKVRVEEEKKLDKKTTQLSTLKSKKKLKSKQSVTM